MSVTQIDKPALLNGATSDNTAYTKRPNDGSHRLVSWTIMAVIGLVQLVWLLALLYIGYRVIN